jgi:hypothetical protein
MIRDVDRNKWFLRVPWDTCSSILVSARSEDEILVV